MNDLNKCGSNTKNLNQKSFFSDTEDGEDCFSSSNIIDECIFNNCKETNLKINFMHYDELRKVRYGLDNHQKNKKQVSPTVSTQSNDNVNNSSINPNPTATDIFNVPANATPQRVFKIVFIGDSGVGKTSFVQRFCNNTFRESFSTTIGVDFQVKSIILDNRVIALQLWDTAGQERYRSITKQYFRKADGVICMYDITSEQSFKNLRNWISSMKESASEDCVLVVIGNKTDLCLNDEKRVVRNKDGAGLAAEYESLFFETSSKESKCILEAMESIARILQEKEDKQIEDVLNLRVKEKKKGCCS